MTSFRLVVTLRSIRAVLRFFTRRSRQLPPSHSLLCLSLSFNFLFCSLSLSRLDIAMCVLCVSFSLLCQERAGAAPIWGVQRGVQVIFVFRGVEG